MSTTLLTLLWWLWPPLATLFTMWSGVFCYRSHQYLRRVQAEERHREAERRERASVSELFLSSSFDAEATDLANLSSAIRRHRLSPSASPSEGDRA